MNGLPKFTFAFVFALALLIKFVEWYLFPVADIDAFGTIGEIFTSSIFPSRNYFYNTGSLYISGYWAFLFFKLFNNLNSIFIFYSLFSAFSLLTLSLYLKKPSNINSTASLILLSATLSPYLYNQRAESIGLFTSLIFLHLLSKFKGKSGIKYILLLTNLILAFFVHPVAFLTCTYLLFVSLWSKHQYLLVTSNRNVKFIAITSLLFLLILWGYFRQGEVSNYYISHLVNRFSNPSVESIFNFTLRNSLLALITLATILKLNGALRWSLLGFVIMLMFLKRDFYYIYMIPVLAYFYIHVVSESYRANLSSKHIYPAALLSGFLTFINPLFIKGENKSHIEVARSISPILNNYSFPSETLVHCDPGTAAPFVFRDQTRQIIIGKKDNEFYPREEISPGDMVVLQHPYQVKQLLQKHPAEIKVLIAPVEGMLSARSFYQQRQDSLGLFLCKIVE